MGIMNTSSNETSSGTVYMCTCVLAGSGALGFFKDISGMMLHITWFPSLCLSAVCGVSPSAVMALIVCVYVCVCRLWEDVFMQMRVCRRTRKSSKQAAGWAILRCLNATLCSCSEKQIHQTEGAELKEKQILLTNKSNVNTQKWLWMPALQRSNVQLEEV